MTINTQTGRTYAVTSTAGCSVTDSNGLTLCTVDAGTQGYFVATGNTATITGDDAAAVTLLFNSALLKLRLLAGGSKLLPSGYTTISYLENAIANQGIYTNVFSIDAKTVEIKAKSNSKNDYLFGQVPYVDGARYLNTSGWDQAGESLFYARSANKLVQYWQPDLVFFTGTPRVYKFNAADNTLTVDAIEGRITSYALTTKFNNLPFALLGLTFVNTDLTYYLTSKVGTRCYYFKLSSAAGELEANYIPCLDASGKPCMFDTVSKQAYYNAGEGDFIAGIDATAQITTLLRNLPDLTGQEAKTLQIRLADSIRTEEMEAYITAQGTAKNWLISHAA